ncbi:MAG: hypothetical protein ACTHQM_08940 [Thermoanaerobaculia bacterium]
MSSKWEIPGVGVIAVDAGANGKEMVRLDKAAEDADRTRDVPEHQTIIWAD